MIYHGSMQSEDHRRTALPLVHWTLCRCQQYGAFSMKALARYQIILLGEQSMSASQSQGCCALSSSKTLYMWSPQWSLPVHGMQSCWSLFSICIIIRVGRAICTNNDWLVHQWIFQFQVLCKVFIFRWVSACAWLSGSAGVSSSRAEEILQDGWPRESDCRPLWEWHGTYRPRRG